MSLIVYDIFTILWIRFHKQHSVINITKYYLGNVNTVKTKIRLNQFISYKKSCPFFFAEITQGIFSNSSKFFAIFRDRLLYCPKLFFSCSIMSRRLDLKQLMGFWTFSFWQFWYLTSIFQMAGFVRQNRGNTQILFQISSFVPETAEIDDFWQKWPWFLTKFYHAHLCTSWNGHGHKCVFPSTPPPRLSHISILSIFLFSVIKLDKSVHFSLVFL